MQCPRDIREYRRKFRRRNTGERSNLTKIQESGLPIPENLQQSLRLTDHAVSSRYPGVSEEVSEEEYRRAIELAEDPGEWSAHPRESAAILTVDRPCSVLEISGSIGGSFGGGIPASDRTCRRSRRVVCPSQRICSNPYG